MPAQVLEHTQMQAERTGHDKAEIIGNKNTPMLPSIASGVASGTLRPLVDVDKVQTRSSNAVSVASRYHHRDVTQDYEILSRRVLGEGCCGKVVVAKSFATGQKYALKRIKKKSVSPPVLQQLIAEVEIHLTLDHPNVAQLNNVYETDSEIALVTECLDGRELYSRLAELKTFPEALAAETAQQMLQAVGYLHSHDIVHRDLKLENFLYQSRRLDSPLKVIDFGMAEVWDSSKPMRAECGSLAYASPDVLYGLGYTSQCDLWSIGVIVFTLLAGHLPFQGDDENIRSCIFSADIDWKHKQQHWSKVSRLAIDFVESLLVLDPRKRLDACAALKHRWLLSTKADQHSPLFSAATLRSLGSYTVAPFLKRVALQLLARELAPGDVASLRRTFLALADDTGTVNYSDLELAICRAEPVVDEENEAEASPNKRAKTDRVRQIFQVMDVNGDGQIYYSEFLAAIMSESLTFREEQIRAVFHRLDADHSGSISTDDIQVAIGDSLDGADPRMLMRDAGLTLSEHGEITFESFKQMLTTRITCPIAREGENVSSCMYFNIP